MLGSDCSPLDRGKTKLGGRVPGKAEKPRMMLSLDRKLNDGNDDRPGLRPIEFDSGTKPTNGQNSFPTNQP